MSILDAFIVANIALIAFNVIGMATTVISWGGRWDMGRIFEWPKWKVIALYAALWASAFVAALCLLAR